LIKRELKCEREEAINKRERIASEKKIQLLIKEKKIKAKLLMKERNC